MSKKINTNKLLNLENEFYKKPRINSRAKGNNFERALAKKLNTRFNTKEFCRTPGSGAFGTTHTLPEHLKIHGDLITPEAFKFVIEAKKGYDVKLEDVWREKSDLYAFIEQAKRDAKASKREWLLIYKKDRQKEIVITEKNHPAKEQLRIHEKYYVYLLEDFLSLPNEHFFENFNDGFSY
jgi:Holliday junction resolvase